VGRGRDVAGRTQECGIGLEKGFLKVKIETVVGIQEKMAVEF
jgi:hypothetical protein